MGQVRSFILLFFIGFTFVSCNNDSDSVVNFDQFYSTLPKYGFNGHISLYGEAHAVQIILDKELGLWSEAYASGARHLFIEMPFYTAEYLNIWMHENNDTILTAIYEDWYGTVSYNPIILNFYRKIKANCPETVFHGTDVGHQYWSTGERYIKYLEDNNLASSEEYSLAKEAIQQGMNYYKDQNAVYRENTMVSNFCREVNTLSNTDIVGFYGSAHTGLNSANYTGQVPSMASQLNYIYDFIIHSEDLTR